MLPQALAMRWCGGSAPVSVPIATCIAFIIELRLERIGEFGGQELLCDGVLDTILPLVGAFIRFLISLPPLTV